MKRLRTGNKIDLSLFYIYHIWNRNLMCSNYRPGGCSSAGRALRSQCRGRGFESLHLHPASATARSVALGRSRGAIALGRCAHRGLRRERVSNPWFETVAVAQRRAQKRLPPSVYGALVAGSERGLTTEDNVAAFGELG